LHSLLADLVLVLHFAYVLFVLGGFALTWAGYFFGWGWVRNLRFRILHLAAIGFVALESWIGAICPLTLWEDLLRREATQASFMQRWVHRLLFYDLPEWVFTLGYSSFLLLATATFLLLPPRPLHLR
jgi:hypothetical protein